MSSLKQLIQEIHRRSLWQVLAIYIAASWIVFEVVQTMTEGLGLPNWLPAFALVLLLVGLPIVIATAFVQEGLVSSKSEAEPSSTNASEVEAAAGAGGDEGLRRLLTWRHALLGGVAALALWGVAATGWLLLAERVVDSARPRSIAVLPFDNLSGDDENEFFSEGITDDIITHLSKLSGLKVISRTSVMRYKETDKSLRQIAGELGVATVLEGGVQRSGDQVRINAQLIDAASDEHLWAEQYNARLTDVFAIQTDIALQIAGALQAQLSPQERGRVERSPTENLEAYNLYLQGRFFWNKRTPEGLQTGIEYFEQALEVDPDYALAWVGVSDSYVILANWGYLSVEDTYERAKSAALKALESDESLGEAHIALAHIHQEYEWDMERAVAEFERGIALSPGYASGHQWYGFTLSYLGRLDEAVAQLERAVELDPLSLIINTNLGTLYRLQGEAERAVEQLQRVSELDPNYPGVYQELGFAYEDLAAYDDAIRAYRRALDLSEKRLGLGELGHLNGRMGRTEEALAMLSELEAEAKTRFVSPVELAIIYAGLGRLDRAYEWVDRAVEERDATLLWRIDTPGFDELRSDPRYAGLLEALGLSSYRSR